MKYDFSKVDQFNKDMLSSFYIENIINNITSPLSKDTQIVENTKNIYGNIKDLKNIKEKFKSEVKRLSELETNIDEDYLEFIINKRNNIKSVDEKAISEMNEDKRNAIANNMGSYKHSFVNLCFAKTSLEFENIVSALNINYEFKNFNVLLVRILENEKIKNTLKENRKNVIINFMNSKYKLSSAEQFLDLIFMCPDKIKDPSYIQLLSDIKDQKIESEKNGLYSVNNGEEPIKASTMKIFNDTIKLIRDNVEKLNNNDGEALMQIKTLNNIIKEVFEPLIKSTEVSKLDGDYIATTLKNTDNMIDKAMKPENIKTRTLKY